MSNFKKLSLILTLLLCGSQMACKKKNEVPNEKDPKALTDSITNDIVYGTNCASFLRKIKGAELRNLNNSNDGGYVIAGNTNYLIGKKDSYLLKTDCFGKKEWDREIKLNANSEGQIVTQLADGQIIVCNKILTSNNDQIQISSISENNDLNWNWEHNILGSGDIRSLIEGHNNSILLLISRYIGNNVGDILINLNENGSQVWQKDPSFEIRLHAIDRQANNYLAVGQKENQSMLVKYNTQGDTVWTKSIPIQGANSAHKVRSIGNDDIIVAGITVNNNFFYTRSIFFSRHDSNGNLIWSKTYHNDGYSDFKEIACSSDNFLFTVAAFESTQYILKIDLADGNIVWARPAGTVAALSILSKNDGGAVYIGLDSISTSHFRRTDSNGY